MTTFIQLHLLTAYPAANLNRDDTGAPKTVVLGGATRLRVSSQSLKRAWRTSALFEQALAGHIGIRSGRIAREAATILIEKGIEEKKAIEWAAKIADYLGKAKNDKKPKDPLTNAETEQLVHISPAEFDAVKALAHQLAEEKRAPKEEDLALLRKDRMAVDIAMFGRMLANKPEFNVEAACQVAHAFGVSETIVEDDFFTAVDDLRQASEDAGAGHLGETGFGSALFYTYICIDKDLLMEAKRQVRGQAEGSDVWLHQQQAALDWLAAQGERSGFTLLDTSVDAYRQQQLRRENSRQLIQFSSVDYTGMLTVTDPGLFLQRLSQGYGKSRAFGCGLMLIKPGAEV
ncbi:type I-E CRISPR-associated protein Cas7/Cse4/CasC [Escherichia coli]|nr:type I-E CRISPR-associated protein Cas7/Cse4/CasC [Escherichia coli]